MSAEKAKRISLKILKISGWVIFSVILLLLLVAVAVQIPWVQQRIKDEAISFLEGKLNTEVRLDHFSLSFPKKVVLTGLYLEDQKKDTLLYAGRLGIDTDLWALTKNKIELSDIELEDFTAHVSRPANDSAFNFDYILKAFADTTATKPDTVSKPWEFAIGDILLEDLNVSLDDKFSGNHVRLRLSKFEILMDEFDLANSSISVNEINVEGIDASITQTKLPEVVPDSAEVVPEDSTAVAFNIDFNEVNLEDINAVYDHSALGQFLRVSIPEASVEANEIDIKKQIINLSRVMLSGSHIVYQQMKVDRPQLETVVEKHNEQQNPWSFALDELELSGNTIQYYDFNQPFKKDAVDFNHLWISALSADARDIRFYENDIRAVVGHFSFREKSGFQIKRFSSVLAVNQTSVKLNNFFLQTGNSKIVMKANATFPSLESIADTYPEAVVALDLSRSTLSLRDALYFQPHLWDSLQLKRPLNTMVVLDAAVNGPVKDIEIHRLRLHALSGTSIFASGHITGLPDFKTAFLNLRLDKFRTTKKDIVSILPDTVLPQSLVLPDWIELAAAMKGTMETPEVKSELTTNYGSARVDMVVNLRPEVKENYRGSVAIEQFALGKLLGQPEKIGIVDLDVAVNGSGVKIDDLNGIIELVVNEFQYGGYSYRDFTLEGSMKKYFFSGTAQIHDENLDFVLKGDLDYNNDVPHYAFTFDLKNADFEKLGLALRPLKARAQLAVDLKTSDFKVVNGKAGIRNFAIYNGDKLYSVDSLLVASLDQEGRSELTISSEILTGEFKGTLNVFSLPDLLNRHFNQYFSMRDTVYGKPVQDQQFTFNMVIKNTDLITEVLVPDLEPFVPGEIAGEFNSAEDRLNLRFKISEILYGGVGIDTVSLRVISDPNSLDFTFLLNKVAVDTLRISALRLAGNIMHDSIRTNLMILDSLGEEKYFLGGVFNSFEDAFQFRFLQHHIKLNYEEWESPLYNSLRFTDAGLDPNNFWIRKGDERILLLRKNNADSTLSIVFNQVNLKNVTSIVEGTTPIGGIIDGDLTLGSAKNASFSTDLRVNELQILEQVWGDLAFLVSKEGEGPMHFNVALDGENAKLKSAGILTSDAEPVIAIDGGIERLNLAVVEPLTMGQLKNLKGNLTGTFKVQGKTKDPLIDGRVTFHDTEFLATYVNSDFIIPDETITLNNSLIRFDKFEILDKKKNKAVIDGSIAMQDQGGMGLNLSLNTRNFQVLNTDEGDNELFYGKVRINTNATIRGTTVLPKVTMNVSLVEGSDVTYVVPQAEKGILDQKGIVVFVDKDAKDDPFMESINPRDTIGSTFSGLDLTANIELTEKESFSIIIDPLTGDKLFVKGNSTLTLHMNPSGEIELTGRYEIAEGTYDLSFYKLVKRNFSITKGSTITWSGDPLNADMDISALYEVETSPIELVANQVTEEELSIYKEQVPFHVFLNIKGQLLSPEISFRLDMPENERNAFGGNVYAKLQDINTRESDLNKQVFALLLLQRFVSDNPFENQAAGGIASSARSSVSKILSEQLNRLSLNVKGIELSFDVKSYENYSSGKAEGQTDLELGISKSLLNDRLVVKVAGNVNLEGETQKQNSVTDYLGDLALEYKLTEDGRFRITGFRNSDYDMIDGDLIETGAGLIYIKDYDTLRELFKSNAKNNK
jgi:translocation and assembly module TamB